jgi:hypothetical protein
VIARGIFGRRSEEEADAVCQIMRQDSETDPLDLLRPPSPHQSLLIKSPAQPAGHFDRADCWHLIVLDYFQL